MLSRLAFLFVLSCPAVALAAAGSAAPLREQPVQTLPKWQDFAERQGKALGALATCEQDRSTCDSPDMVRWADMVSGLRGQNKLRQIITVNRWFNRLIYKFDGPVDSRADHWSDTEELLSNRGDCEDFALGKYYTLRVLGFQPEELRVAVVYDKLAYANHAVVMVYLPGTRYLLDINSDDTEPSPMEYQFRPIYAFNERTAWFY